MYAKRIDFIESIRFASPIEKLKAFESEISKNINNILNFDQELNIQNIIMSRDSNYFQCKSYNNGLYIEYLVNNYHGPKPIIHDQIKDFKFINNQFDSYQGVPTVED
jgi:prolyl oligopeptidase PreP (S9A serine peptidase family)